MDIYFAVSDAMRAEHSLREAEVRSIWHWTLSTSTCIKGIISHSEGAVLDTLALLKVPFKNFTIYRAFVPDYEVPSLIQALLAGDNLPKLPVLITKQVISF